MLKMSMFSDMKKAGLNTAAKAARKVIKNQFSQPITSTLNDFSIIEKATLRFASTDDYDPTPPIPVQINPNEISYNYESYATHKNVITNILGESRVVESSKDPFLKSKMTFTLYYDFYDAVKAAFVYLIQNIHRFKQLLTDLAIFQTMCFLNGDLLNILDK